ncbi:MAG: hypothetical protein O3B09_01260 [Proteobacteria bacterium]|nr:hypothetical protein [Pseudomonadota bacterium]
MLEGGGVDIKDNPVDNEIQGSTGEDTIRGLAGNDKIKAGGGQDELEGGAGDDVLEGGSGVDSYVFADLSVMGRDVIVDADADSKIILEGVQLSASAKEAVDEAGDVIANTWVLEHNSRQYYLTRVDEYSKQSATGKNLLLVPLPAVDNSNSITIKDFNFENGGFGIVFKSPIGEFDLFTNPLEYTANPTITNLSSGKFVAAWESTRQDGSKTGIYAQIFNQNGEKSGDEFQVSSYVTDGQDSPAVSAFSDSSFVVTWEKSSSGKVFAKILDIQGNELTASQTATLLTSQIPTIQPSSNTISLKPINAAGPITGSGGEGSDIFVIETDSEVTGSVTYEINNFGGAGGDKIDISSLNLLPDLDIGDGFANSTSNSTSVDPTQVKILRDGNNTTITVPNGSGGGDVTITLLNYPIENITQSMFIPADVQLVRAQIGITGLDQIVQYNQIDSNVALAPIVIDAEEGAELDVTITLRDRNGKVIDNGLLIPISPDTGEAFANGVWSVSGNEAHINELLSDLTIEMDESFQDQDIFIDVQAEDLTNHVNVTGAMVANYDCVALPVEFNQFIQNQTTIAGQALAMDMLRFIADNNTNFSQLQFSLIAQGNLEIERLNQTAFQITPNQAGSFNLTAQIANECGVQDAQNFFLQAELGDFVSPTSFPTISPTNGLETAYPTSSPTFSPTPTAQNQSALNQAIIPALIAGGGVLLLVGGLYALYKNRDKVAACCASLFGAAGVCEKESQQATELAINVIEGRGGNQSSSFAEESEVTAKSSQTTTTPKSKFQPREEPQKLAGQGNKKDASVSFG